MRVPLGCLALTALFASCGASEAREAGTAAETASGEDDIEKKLTIEDFYRVDFLPTPTDVAVEVGGMDFLSDGRLVVSTRRGEVWIIENPLAEDTSQVRYKLFADGLNEGLGLRVVDDVIHVVQRTELSRLRDTNRDGRCDGIEIVSNDWGCSGNYHEFAYGLPTDRAGNFFVSLNLGFFTPYWYIGQAKARYRGWVLRISPSGKTTPFAYGFRSPNGLGTDPDGELFVTDNQGDWMPVCPLYHVQRGRFYGHPSGLDSTLEYRARGERASWYEPPRVPRVPPAIWIPYGLSRSTGNMVWDQSRGRFGPFEGQIFAAEVTNGLVLRCQLEKVRGEYQGSAFCFRRRVGTANRVVFAHDGSLFCGLTSRGWGGEGAAHGISRIRFTGRTPMEMQRIQLRMDGFDVHFTLPVEGEFGPEQVRVSQYDLSYHWKYGSPATNVRKLEVLGAELLNRKRTLRLRLADLRQGYMTRIVLDGVEGQGGVPMFNNQADYTLNQFPRGPRGDKLIASVVPPPLTRERETEGFVQLMDQKHDLVMWRGEGWNQFQSVQLERKDPKILEPRKGRGIVANVPAEKAPRVTQPLRFAHPTGDIALHVEFLLPKEGRAQVCLMDRYRVNLSDSKGKKGLSPEDSGGIEGSPAGSAPRVDAAKKHGQWQEVDLVFRAPRFDGKGSKIADARFERVVLNDITVQEDFELTGPSKSSEERSEVARAALTLRGDTHVAFRSVRLKLLDRPKDEGGWVSIFNGKDLDGWKKSGEAEWTVENGILRGSGKTGHLFSPRSDYKNLEFRARCRLGYKSNSGMYFRAAYGPGWPKGYEAQVCHSYRDPQKTGSLYGLARLAQKLVSFDDTWFEQHITCRDVADGTRITIRVNGLTVVDHVDRERRHGAGHVALQQHHEGSVVEYRQIQVRELR